MPVVRPARFGQGLRPPTGTGVAADRRAGRPSARPTRPARQVQRAPRRRVAGQALRPASLLARPRSGPSRWRSWPSRSLTLPARRGRCRWCSARRLGRGSQAAARRGPPVPGHRSCRVPGLPPLLVLPHRSLSADLEGQQQVAPVGEHAVELGEHRGQMCRGNVDDRVPGYEAGQARVGRVERAHLADVEGDLGVFSSGEVDHRRGEVDPADR